MGLWRVRRELEKEITETRAEMKELKRDSEEYAKLYQHLKELTETYAKLCSDPADGWNILLGLGSLALGAGGLVLRAKLAEEAHKEDKDMLISNGRIRSLAEKPMESFKGFIDTKIGSKRN